MDKNSFIKPDDIIALEELGFFAWDNKDNVLVFEKLMSNSFIIIVRAYSFSEYDISVSEKTETFKIKKECGFIRFPLQSKDCSHLISVVNSLINNLSSLRLLLKINDGSYYYRVFRYTENILREIERYNFDNDNRMQYIRHFSGPVSILFEDDSLEILCKEERMTVPCYYAV